MNYGVLADRFEGVAAKHLAQVEINRMVSNQHEFQGVRALYDILGPADDPVPFPATYYWMGDEGDEDFEILESYCTWSDVRRNTPNRSEYRLYYPAVSEPLVRKARAGDLLVIAKATDQRLHIFLCPRDTTTEQQLLWLFGIQPDLPRWNVRVLDSGNSILLGFMARSVLNALGMEVEQPEPDALDELISRYGSGFPTGREFSRFARRTLPGIDPVGDPDLALIAWMDHTQNLSEHLERHLVSDRLKAGFVIDGAADLDGFIEFSKSVLNRRRSRAGAGLEHHIEALLLAHNLRYSVDSRTEGNKRPDFIFPGEAEYHTPAYDATLLTMLGAKRTCKDRWRQVLAEARRIPHKHLLTLEPAISAGQTDEMQSENLQLVIPRPLFESYRPAQQSWLMDVAGFIELVKAKQQAVGT